MFSACHRLSHYKDAGILIHFVDLDQRNEWLHGAKNLHNHPGKISVCPDIPPVLRPIKKEIMDYRRGLPSEVKKRSKLRNLKGWPYLKLDIPGQDPYYSKITKEALVKNYLEVELGVDFSKN